MPNASVRLEASGATVAEYLSRRCAEGRSNCDDDGDFIVRAADDGLLAFNVAERRREIALRIAIGAEPPAILRMVVGQGLKLVAIGLVAGALMSFWVAEP